nr:MAG TPA: hypothetical protein [Caudoviricetes sp.]
MDPLSRLDPTSEATIDVSTFVAWQQTRSTSVSSLRRTVCGSLSRVTSSAA